MKQLKLYSIIVAVIVACMGFALQKNSPVLYIIGDSTVKNGTGKGSDSLWGWGSVIDTHFDTTQIKISNQAIGGRSSRTFITEKRWEKILGTLKPGDYVLMQFGHNDAGPLDDTARARGTIRGIGDESKEIYNPIRKQQEVVHTYGWYMRQYIREAKAKGAIPIVCSPVPRNSWKNGKVVLSDSSYGGWAKQVALQEKAFFIDINKSIALEYEKMGEVEVSKQFFIKDHTHTNYPGAVLNAKKVAEGINDLKGCKLKKYLKK
jgi:lysophospholipase L1-like esterase